MCPSRPSLQVHGLVVGSPDKKRADPAVLRALCTNYLVGLVEVHGGMLTCECLLSSQFPVALTRISTSWLTRVGRAR
jgi:hypothetical protein